MARFVLWLLGWKLYGREPDVPKYLYLAYPHSSNWDGLFLLLFAKSIHMDLKWMGKKSLMKPPLGWILKPLGCVGVDRSKSNNMVDQMVEVFAQSERFSLGIPPEGTRSYRDNWKSGFYHIALKANVPVCCGVLDYKKKVGGFGPLIELTGDMDADMDRIRAIYTELNPVGMKPDNVGPMRFRDKSN